ncbi:alpha/beta fold hydrolase [Streptomyces sp. NPDC004647]|uniref:alpha/beta fold hydrolase n=1 Tax=Streptomyces sp. NPDC004647 TaxID=3154671 RepID=UPI0033B85D1D
MGGTVPTGAKLTRYRQPGLVLTDHHFEVPLDHSDPGGERIELFAREVVAPGKEEKELPWLLYLEGGPGFGARRPFGATDWVKRAVQDYRVLLLDQRGTGRSSPADRQTLPMRGDAQAQADYLARFRADAIVQDCEWIRPRLTGGAPWAVLGQSFGGFCAVHYLSTAPEALRTALITGGLPSLDADADEVYRAAYPRVVRKNAAHYARYPQDAATARRIAAHLREHPAELPGGYRFTVEAFQSLGILLGGSGGSHRLHYLLEHSFVRTPAGPHLSDAFLEGARSVLSHAANPLYALLQEAIYAQDGSATGWAAQRVRAEFPEFDADRALESDEPVLFTGEMVYPWMLDADPALRPLRETAELLAGRTGWAPLYDPRRLAANEVPTAAAVYHDDMYVDTGHALDTARTIGGLRTWVTDEFEHDGVRAGGPQVLDRLIALAHGTI